MYKLDLPLDLKESAAIERRKNMEKQRQSRVFNAKVRTIGVDLNSLKQQERDRRMQEEMERRRDEAFAADMIRNDKIACLTDDRLNNDRKNLDKAMNDFRDVHQQPAERREWELYDPEGKKKDKPARVSDDDPRCTIATLQKFDGEDLNEKDRKKLQQEQMREWAKAQMAERKEADDRQKYAEHLYQMKQRELDERACTLAKADDDCRKAIDTSVRDYNNALAEETRQKLSLQKQAELDDNFTEMTNHVTGDMLTENPDVALSAFGPHRVIPDRWKGMSPDQNGEIRRIQELQRAEQKRLQSEDEERNKEWERQAVANARAGIILAREEDRTRKNINKQVADENLRLAAEQKAHQEFLDREVYTNPPTASYFMQWNKTSR